MNHVYFGFYLYMCLFMSFSTSNGAHGFWCLFVFFCGLDIVKANEHKVVRKEEAKDAPQSTTRTDGDCSSISGEGENDGIKINGVNKARAFKFDELVAATENFKAAYFLGEGGFGKVYKGRLADTGQVSSTSLL